MEKGKFINGFEETPVSGREIIGVWNRHANQEISRGIFFKEKDYDNYYIVNGDETEYLLRCDVDAMEWMYVEEYDRLYKQWLMDDTADSPSNNRLAAELAFKFGKNESDGVQGKMEDALLLMAQQKDKIFETEKKEIVEKICGLVLENCGEPDGDWYELFAKINEIVLKNEQAMSIDEENVTKDNLINIVCKWMDFHNGNNTYITKKSNGETFINGSYQTNLRHFINEVISSGIPYWDAIEKAKDE